MKLRWVAQDATSEFLYFGRIYAGFYGRMKEHDRPQPLTDQEKEHPWRAWIATSDEEEHLGDFATRQQAKKALEEAATKPI